MRKLGYWMGVGKLVLAPPGSVNIVPHCGTGNRVADGVPGLFL